MDFKRNRRNRSVLDLTPLIDVVFLLIVFLILTANFQQPSLSLDLPGGNSEDEPQEQSVMVELDAEGNLAIDGLAIGGDGLGAALGSALDATSKRAVRLLADEQVTYGELMPVIEEIRAAGALAVDLVHQGAR